MSPAQVDVLEALLAAYRIARDCGRNTNCEDCPILRDLRETMDTFLQEYDEARWILKE